MVSKSLKTAFFLFLVCGCASDTPPVVPVAPVEPEIFFSDATAGFCVENYSPTFGVAVSDLDNSGTDDLVISNHSRHPIIFLNRGDHFTDASQLLGYPRSDLHGVAAVDIDNDGDRDLIFACGGADGIGPGCPNRLFVNKLWQSGETGFNEIAGAGGMSLQSWRSRHFLPLAGPDGSMIDFFLACLSRENCPDIYFSNRTWHEPAFAAEPLHGLNQNFSSEGKDIFFDFDRDGDQDLLLISRHSTVFLENRNGIFFEKSTEFSQIRSVYSAGTGDVNNDGFPDIYIGRAAGNFSGDNLCVTGDRIHFVVKNHNPDSGEMIRFATHADWIEFNFIRHTPGRTIVEPDDIFIGRRKINPASRKGIIYAPQAEGEPVRGDLPGIYVWKEYGMNHWRVAWVYGTGDSVFSGKIMAPGISGFMEKDMEHGTGSKLRDLLFLNYKGRSFFAADIPEAAHSGITRDLVFADFDCNGFTDIVGIRGSSSGLCNGSHFILINRGFNKFEFQPLLENPEDDAFQADQLVFGFFDDNGLPDLFMTNGYGLNPGHEGPYKLFLNQTRNPGHYLLLELQGKRCNSDALGAQVEVRSLTGQIMGYRQLGAGYNRSQSTRILHFGLGGYSGEVQVIIRWPGKPEPDKRIVGVDRKLTLKEN